MAVEEKGKVNFSPTMTVNGTTYAVSLFWQPLQSTVNPLPEINEAAKTMVEGADLYCLRKSGVQQYALGTIAKGHKAGLPVAATALVDFLSDRHSSLTVFKVKEGWWFVVIRNDLILSEEEVLYKNEDDAKRAFLAMLAVPDWGRKIAPAEWQLEGTQDIDLAKLFKSRKLRIIRLQPLNAKTGQHFLIFLFIVLCLLGVGTYWGMTYLFPPPKKKPVVRSLPPPVSKEDLGKTPVSVKKPEPQVNLDHAKPWEAISEPYALMKSCQKGAYRLREIFIPGFDLVSIGCGEGTVTGRWTRKMGNNAWLRRIPHLPDIKENPEFSYTLAGDGSSITGKFKIDPVRTISSPPKLMNKPLKDDLDDYFKTIKHPISFGAGAETVKVQPISAEVQIPGAPPPKEVEFKYPYVSFTLSTTFMPESWERFIKAYSGLEIKKISYNIANKTWTYEGVIYEKDKKD